MLTRGSSRFFWPDVGGLDKEWQAEYEARRSRQEPRLYRRTPIYAGHGMPIALIDFLNSREDAILFWVVAILAFVAWNPREIGADFLGVLRAFLQPKLLLLFGSTALYCALIVVAGMEFGLWHTSSIKPTIYWFFGTAIVLAGYAVTRSPSDPRFLRGVFKPVLAVTILTDFIVNLYLLPFGYELVLVFVVLVFTVAEVWVRRAPSTDPRVRKFVDRVLITIGVFYFSYFVISALRDLDGFLTRENAEAFLVGPVLTIALIPFLYAWAWISRWDQRRMRARFAAAHDSPA